MFGNVIKRLTAVFVIVAMLVIMIPATVAEENEYAAMMDSVYEAAASGTFEEAEADEASIEGKSGIADLISGAMLTDFEQNQSAPVPRIEKYGFKTFYVFNQSGDLYMGMYDANDNVVTAWNKYFSSGSTGYINLTTDLTKRAPGEYQLLLWTTHTEDIPFYYKVTVSDSVSLSGQTISVTAADYTGSPVIPATSVKYRGYPIVKDRDYTLSATNNIDAGTSVGTVTATGTGVFYGSLSAKFTINKASISDAVLECEDCLYFDGEYREPKVYVTFNGIQMTEGEDYSVTYYNNRNIGTARYTVRGMGNLTGSKNGTFRIYKYSIEYDTVVMNTVESVVYNGSAQTPVPEVYHQWDEPGPNGEVYQYTLVDPSDYDLEYVNNVDVGTATILIHGKGDYGGTKEYNFQITPASIDGATLSPIADQVYTGSAIVPAVNMKVGSLTVPAEGYKVEATNNVNVGTAKAVIKGKGNYTGSIESSFKIVPANVSGADVAEIPVQPHTGKAITPKPAYVKVGGRKLVEDTDYTLSYANNVNSGTASVTITGKGNYTGSKVVNFTIAQLVTEIQLSKDTFALKKGKTGTLTATVLPANATNKEVVWTSSNTSVAMVDKNGNITAVKPGEAIITATAADGSGVKASATLTVMKKLPKKVTLSAKKATLLVGKKVKLKASVTPENCDNKKVIWTSSDPSVATVNQKGKVKAVGVGKCEITATTLNGKKAVCKITVKPVKVTEIVIKGKKSMKVGATQTLTAKITPAKATNKAVIWSCNKTELAVVDENGVVTALAKGTVKITAKAADGSKVKAVFKIKIK